MSELDEKPGVLFSWSGGKDCALALYELLKDDVRVTTLITTVTSGYDRISMHGVRRALLEEQAEAIGLPLQQVEMPQQASNEIYERVMGEAFSRYAEQGVKEVVFGDIFLEDIRTYREDLVRPYELRAIFPLWQQDTTRLAQTFIDAGFRARIACVDTEQLDASFAGRLYDASFLEDLPPTVDPCGENGEFHTYVFDGPFFDYPISLHTGEVVIRDKRFAYCDLLLK